MRSTATAHSPARWIAKATPTHSRTALSPPHRTAIRSSRRFSPSRTRRARRSPSPPLRRAGSRRSPTPTGACGPSATTGRETSRPSRTARGAPARSRTTREGLLSVVTGADGVEEVTNVYDDVDRVVTQTDGAGSVRTIAYGNDHSTTLTDALGNASTIDHNAKGQADRVSRAAGGVTLTGYDANTTPPSRSMPTATSSVPPSTPSAGC